ncbi:hypothetical protein EDC04DRAFT_2606674 [Pisolithus marmoratus]|nr:hypothetical protein EDC04DRAFT_2606674 [Pisolithus marmoratus]
MCLWPLKTIYYAETIISVAMHIFVLKNKGFSKCIKQGKIPYVYGSNTKLTSNQWGIPRKKTPKSQDLIDAVHRLDCLAFQAAVSITRRRLDCLTFQAAVSITRRMLFCLSGTESLSILDELMFSVAIPNRHYIPFIHSTSYHNLWCKSAMGFTCWVDELAFNAAIPNNLLYSILISSLSGHKVLSHELGTSNSIDVYYLFLDGLLSLFPCTTCHTHILNQKYTPATD